MERKITVCESYFLNLTQTNGSVNDGDSAYTGDLIKHIRNEAKVTQAELAARLNVSKSYISRIENGLIMPGVNVFYRIVEALGMRVEIVRPIG